MFLFKTAKMCYDGARTVSSSVTHVNMRRVVFDIMLLLCHLFRFIYEGYPHPRSRGRSSEMDWAGCYALSKGQQPDGYGGVREHVVL